MRRSLRPTIDDLESRSLLTTTPLLAYPTFEIGRLTGGGGPGGGYTPAQVKVAYGFNNIAFGGITANGSGQTIAIVDAYNDPTIQADLNTFDAQFGLPATTVTRVNETGGSSYPAKDSTGGWELEESLDVEWAHAMAPGANILLVEATSNSDTDLLAAVQYAAHHASVVSMSWGGGEFLGETGYDSYFDQPGVAFVASSGDAGAPALWPAASPNVLSVGGTVLTLGANNVWSSETGWGGSGGGPSAYESQPSYQQGVVTQTSSARAAPDVAYDASPSTGFAVYDSDPATNYGWVEVGGTSAGAPQWSALLAIADQGRVLSGQPVLDSTSPQEVMTDLYKNPTDFHDIINGSSTNNSGTIYSAGPGYDYVTGLGSPIANLVVGSLDPGASFDRLVLAAPATDTAGNSFGLTVTAVNASGTTDAGYAGTIHFTSSDVQAGLPANFTFSSADEGSYTFTVTLKTAGSQSITATDTTTSPITGTVSEISVSPAPASQFVLSGLPDTTTAGGLQTVTVSAEDYYGNLVTGYAGTVQFTSSDPKACLPATFNFTTSDHGGEVFPLAFLTAGTQSVTVTDAAAGITATQAGITVQAGAAQSFTITGFPATAMAGVGGHVVVTAHDAYGNVATGYTGTISFGSSDAQALLPTQFSFIAADAGSNTFSITLETVGTQSITATDTASPSITGTESGITVVPAEQLTWSPPAAIVYGTELSAAQLDAMSSVPGTFTYAPAAGVILGAGGQMLQATFAPADATDYTTLTATTTITVTQATPTIALSAPGGTFDGSPFPASVTIVGISGQQGSSLENVSPLLTYYCGTYSNTTQLAGLTPLFGAPVQAGAYTVRASFPGTADYAAATGLAGFTIAQATPQSAWSPPAAIVYGTELSTAQLDATSCVPGTFTYAPAAGAVLDAGAQTLSVTFTPQDSIDYATAFATTTIMVAKATPILQVADAGGTFDGSPFPAAVAILGTAAGVVTPASSLDNVTPTLTYYVGSGTAGTSLGPAPPSTPGTYTVVAAFSGTVDYSPSMSTAVTFTIEKAATTLALTSSGSSSVSRQPVSFLATVSAVAGTPSGTVTFFDGTTRLATVPLGGSGTAMFTTSTLTVGAHSIAASYSGNADFVAVQSAQYSEAVAQTGTQVVVVQNPDFSKKKLISVGLTAEIKPLVPGGDVPTGEVTFEVVTTVKKKVKITTLGTGALVGGQATLTLKASKLPPQGITIIYSGDANDMASSVTTPRLT